MNLTIVLLVFEAIALLTLCIITPNANNKGPAKKFLKCNFAFTILVFLKAVFVFYYAKKDEYPINDGLPFLLNILSLLLSLFYIANACTNSLSLYSEHLNSESGWWKCYKIYHAKQLLVLAMLYCVPVFVISCLNGIKFEDYALDVFLFILWTHSIYVYYDSHKPMELDNHEYDKISTNGLFQAGYIMTFYGIYSPVSFFYAFFNNKGDEGITGYLLDLGAFYTFGFLTVFYLSDFGYLLKLKINENKSKSFFHEIWWNLTAAAYILTVIPYIMLGWSFFVLPGIFMTMLAIKNFKKFYA